MNKKVISTLTAGTFALLFTACGDTLVDADDPPINTTAKLTVAVTDVSSGKALSGATVRLLSTGDSAVTADNGNASFPSVYLGQHTIQVEKAGYLSVSATPTVSSTLNQNVAIANESNVPVSLSPKNASLDGYLYWTDKTVDANIDIPAQGAKVVVRYTSSNILDRYSDTVTVDANGKYTFSNLAAGQNYTIIALPFTTANGYTFNALSNNGSDLSSYTPVHFSVQKYGNDISVFTLISYTSKVTTEKPEVVFTFSDEVSDATKKIYADASINQPLNSKWEGNKLTVTPAGGKWLSSSFSISLSSNIESKKGNTITKSSFGNRLVTVEDFYPNLTGQSITVQVNGIGSTGTLPVNSVTTIELTWNKLAETECFDYYVYYKTPIGTSYQRIYADPLGTTKCIAEVDVTPTTAYADKKYAFTVQAIIDYGSKSNLFEKEVTVAAQ
jgi:hypothetical protein